MHHNQFHQTARSSDTAVNLGGMACAFDVTSSNPSSQFHPPPFPFYFPSFVHFPFSIEPIRMTLLIHPINDWRRRNPRPNTFGVLHGNVHGILMFVANFLNVPKLAKPGNQRKFEANTHIQLNVIYNSMQPNCHNRQLHV